MKKSTPSAWWKRRLSSITSSSSRTFRVITSFISRVTSLFPSDTASHPRVRPPTPRIRRVQGLADYGGMRLPSARRLLGRRKPRDGRQPAPFVVGVSRSGTTLLRLMLDAHPQLTIPPQTHFVPKLISHCERWIAAGAETAELRERAFGLITTHPPWGDLRP